MNYFLKTIIGLLISASFMVVFFYTSGFQEVMNSLLSAKLIYLIPAIFLYFISLYIRTLRWQYILKTIINVKTGVLFKSIVIGYSTNNILPIRLGELIRLYYVSKITQISKSTILGTIITERIMDAITLVSYIAIILSVFISLNLIKLETFYSTGNFIVSAMLIGSISILIIFTILIWVAKEPSIMKNLLNKIFSKISQINKNKIIDIYNLFIIGLLVLKRFSQLANMFSISVLIWLFECFLAYILVLSFGLEHFNNNSVVLFFIIILVVSVANLATTIPLTQGGIGPFELGGSLTLIMFGVDAPYAGAFMILLHALLLIPVTALGLLFIFIGDESFFEVMKNSSKLANHE